MYIRTPKKYRGMQRRNGFSCRRFFSIGILVVLIIIGIGIYEMRDMVRPHMMAVVDTAVAEVDTWQATQFAPTPEPTQDATSVLIDADNEWGAGRIRFALNSYSEVVNLLPNDVRVHIRLAEGYLTRGNIEDAYTYAESAVTADPFSADAWATRALVYSWEDDFAEGIASAQQALALNPDNVRATAYLGYAYFQAGEYTLANSRAEEAIALDPNHWSGYWVRGLIRENVFPVDLVGAQEDFQLGYNLAQEQNPAMAGVVGSGLGRVVSVTNAQQAVTIFNEMLNLDESNREVLFYLAFTHYFYLGEWAQVQEILSDCVDIAPDDVECWYLLGRARFNLDDQDGALDAFEQTIELGTPFARHYWWAAHTERVLGSCAAATPYLQTGYDMVTEGGRPAEEEGDIDLIAAYEAELGTCRITFVPANPTPETTPEVETADG